MEISQMCVKNGDPSPLEQMALYLFLWKCNYLQIPCKTNILVSDSAISLSLHRGWQLAAHTPFRCVCVSVSYGEMVCDISTIQTPVQGSNMERLMWVMQVSCANPVWRSLLFTWQLWQPWQFAVDGKYKEARLRKKTNQSSLPAIL